MITSLINNASNKNLIANMYSENTQKIDYKWISIYEDVYEAIQPHETKPKTLV